MAIKYSEEYRDPGISRGILEKIHALSRKEIRLMEVCGTHTVSIFRSGIRTLLPPRIQLLSGPGCPVCVTAQNEIDAFIDLARRDDVIVTTFGDLVRVPGSQTSLQKERAGGRDIRIVYSAMDAVGLARKHLDKMVAFLGVGFETTAPTIAASIMAARQMKLDNYLVFSAHKLVPPALTALAASPDINVDGFLLPGHVSVIIGLEAYRPFFEETRLPCAVAGFEPTDLIEGIHLLVQQIETNEPRLDNAYPRAVTAEGNTKAREVMETVFKGADANWRGIGVIPRSGLEIRAAFSDFDARVRLDMEMPHAEEPRGCACSEILTGVKTPPQCPLYKKVCTPEDPVGPCMVSSEGTCAAYYRYHSDS